MRIIDIAKLPPRFEVLRRMIWGGSIAEVGAIVRIEDPALARELVAAGKVAPASDRARNHLTKPAKWTEPKTTAVSPRNSGIFSRESPWRQIE